MTIREIEAGVFANTVCTCIDCRAHRAKLLRRLNTQTPTEDAVAETDIIFVDTVGGCIE